MFKFKKKAKPNLDEVFLTLEDYAGFPTRVQASQVEEWQKEQEILRGQMERGEIHDPRTGPSPEQIELGKELERLLGLTEE